MPSFLPRLPRSLLLHHNLPFPPFPALASSLRPFSSIPQSHNLQDKRDDVAAGVHSTALLFGTRTKPILTGFATAQVCKHCMMV